MEQVVLLFPCQRDLATGVTSITNRSRVAGHLCHSSVGDPHGGRAFMAKTCVCCHWGCCASINSSGRLLPAEVSPKKQVRCRDTKASEGALHRFGYIPPKQHCLIQRQPAIWGTMGFWVLWCAPIMLIRLLPVIPGWAGRAKHGLDNTILKISPLASAIIACE